MSQTTLWMCLLSLAGGHASSAAQIIAAPSEQYVPPADAVEFARVTTTAKITQRFEIYNPHSRTDLEAVKEMGFTQVILDRANLHSDASRIGLDVVLANWWTRETPWPEIQRVLELAREVDADRLSAISMMDEPERYAPQTPLSVYRSLYDRLRSQLDDELPGVRLEISHWGPLSNWTPAMYERFIPLYRAADRMRIMPYPDLDEGPLADVYYTMLRSRNLMAMAGRELPQVVILQTWVLPDEPQLPTIDELRVMAYQAMLAGADTLSFFSYDPKLWQQTEGFTEGFTRLMRELADLSERFREATIETTIDEAGILTAMLTQPDGRQTTILVNTRRTSVNSLAPLEVVVPSPPGATAKRPTYDRAVAPARYRIRGSRLGCRFRQPIRWRHCR